jgi:antitoxin component YwqK of YwqJK toxin-antitoxin module
MLKQLLFLVIIFCALKPAKGQIKDTSIYYFKYTNFNQRAAKIVMTADSADFIRVLLPADSGDKKLNIREYYPNGQVKLASKAYTNNPNNLKAFRISLAGDCLSFYPDGKRSHLIHYDNGFKNGDEYQYYPNGKLYSRITNRQNEKGGVKRSLFADCYAPDGKQICTDGNGYWVIYNENDFKTVTFEGSVLNGLPEGSWHGTVYTGDTIKYVYNYRNGEFVDGIGIDEKGVSHPFKNEVSDAYFKGGSLAFMNLMGRKVHHFNDSTGQKLSLRNVFAQFLVEKNGKISNVKIYANDLSVLAKQEIATILSDIEWEPAKYVGVPVADSVFTALKQEYYSSYDSGTSHIFIRP